MRLPDDPDTVGDVRRIQTGKYVNHEEIVQLVPNTKFSYTILDGMLHDYKGEVMLTALAEGGTKIEWTGAFKMSIPGAGRFFMEHLRWCVPQTMPDVL